MYTYAFMYIEKDAAMGIATYTDFRARLAGYMDKVCDERDVLYVTRHNARTVVVLSEEEYEGLIETARLLRSPANSSRLLQSIDDANANKLTEREI
jgi:antitoxin YefM